MMFKDILANKKFRDGLALYPGFIIGLERFANYNTIFNEETIYLLLPSWILRNKPILEMAQSQMDIEIKFNYDKLISRNTNKSSSFSSATNESAENYLGYNVNSEFQKNNSTNGFTGESDHIVSHEDYTNIINKSFNIEVRSLFEKALTDFLQNFLQVWYN